MLWAGQIKRWRLRMLSIMFYPCSEPVEDHNGGGRGEELKDDGIYRSGKHEFRNCINGVTDFFQNKNHFR